MSEEKVPAFAPDGMCPRHSLYPRKCVVCEVEALRHVAGRSYEESDEARAILARIDGVDQEEK